jgi:hypothetical protein
MYTLSGNSNILQALNIVGGINEEMAVLEKYNLKRANKEIKVLICIKLYYLVI